MFDIEQKTRLADAIDRKAAALANGSEKEILALSVAYQSEYIASQLQAIYRVMVNILDELKAKGFREDPNLKGPVSKVVPLFDHKTNKTQNYHQPDLPEDQE
jgi:hypothetical protein